MPTRDDMIKELQRQDMIRDLEMQDKKQDTPKDTGYGETAVRGAAEGATLGFSPNIEGAAKAGYNAILGDKTPGQENFADAYRQQRDQARQANEKAASDNPKTYYGSMLAGGVATAPLMGEASLLKTALTGAAIGLGNSTADLTKPSMSNYGNAALDTGIGMGTGVATHGLIQGVKSLTPRSLASKAAKVLMGTPEEVTNTYIDNPEAVRNAPTRFQLAQNYGKTLEDLKNEVVQGSKASRDQLAKEGTSFKGTEIADQLKPITERLKASDEGVSTDPKKEAVYNYLKSIQDKFTPQPGEEMGPVPDKSYSGNRMKDLVKEMQDATDYQRAPGQVSPLDTRLTGESAASLNNFLKSKSPAYENMMKGVASDTELLNRARDVGGEKSLPNIFRRLETDKFGAGQAPRETINNLDQRMGTNFLEQIPQSMAKETFDKSITNGSRNVNLWSNSLRDVPVLKYLAPLVGATVDKFGNKITQAGVDKAAQFESFLNNPNAGPGGMLDMKSFTEAAKAMADKAAQGDPGARLNMYLLNKYHPEVNSILKNVERPLGIDRKEK